MITCRLILSHAIKQKLINLNIITTAKVDSDWL